MKELLVNSLDTDILGQVTTSCCFSMNQFSDCLAFFCFFRPLHYITCDICRMLSLNEIGKGALNFEGLGKVLDGFLRPISF